MRATIRHDEESSAKDNGIRLRNVGVRLGGRAILRKVYLDADPGDVIGLMGPNGSGKSTLLKMLAGLVVPSSGEGSVCGRPLGGGAAGRVGLMLEIPPFIDHRTGEENLALLEKVGGPSPIPSAELMRMVGLDPKDRTAVGAYSQGMRKRLGFAQALQTDPQVYLLDEPMNGLDPLGMIMMREKIAELSAAGRIVVVSSHLLDELERICTKVYLVNGGCARQVEGRFLREGLLEEVYVSEVGSGTSED